MKTRMFARTVAVAATCAVVGGAAGIASSGATTKKTTSTTSTTTTGARPPDGRGGFGHGLAVHAEEVVLDKAGTAYITETEDSGTVVSVSGDQVTIKEATDGVTYKTVTLTIPSGATISRNGSTDALSAFVAGDHVQVTSSSDGTSVFGGDATNAGHGHGPGGPPPSGPSSSSSSTSSSSATTSG